MVDRIVIDDTFSRTVTDDWGSADNGTRWEIQSGTAADFDVDGADGTIALPDTVEHLITFPGNFTRLKGTWTVSANQVATGASFVSTLRVRTLDTSNYLAIQVEFKSDGTIVIALYKIVAGVVTQLGAVNKGAYSADQDWNVACVVGSGTTFQGKLWSASTSEPSAFDVTASTSGDLSGPGAVVLRTVRDGANTNTGLVLSYDAFQVTTFSPVVQIIPQYLDDYEFKFGHDGLVLNGGQSNATLGNPIWDIYKVTGLDLPDIKVSDKEFDGIDGGVVEAVNLKMRTIRLDGTLYAHQDDSLEEYLDQLKTNFAPVPRESSGELFDPNQKPFFLKPPGKDERFLFAKPVGLSYDWDPDRRFNTTPFQIILQCQVPTQFSPALHSLTQPLSGIISDPAVFQVYNAGNCWSYAVVRLFRIGTFPDVHIEHIEQDKDLALFIDSQSLADRPLEINFRQRTVFISDDPPVNIRQDTVAEGWWRLAPGMNTIHVRTDISNNGEAEILWRDEWY